MRETGDAPRNMIRNGSFDTGDDLPDAWEWVVVRGRANWRFDESRRFTGRRSVCLMQDRGKIHGEFRQVVPAQGGVRYRLRGRIDGFVEGSGEESGANFSLTALRAGDEISTMRFRPFLTGRCEWELWSCDYVTPEGTDALRISFDMRNSDGAARFDAVELFEVPAPPYCSAPPSEISARQPAAAAPGRAGSVAVVSDLEASIFAREFLEPLVGPGAVAELPLTALARAKADAVAIIKSPEEWTAAEKPSFGQVLQTAQRRLVVLNPRCLAWLAEGRGVGVEEVRRTLSQPCARIEREGFLTRGFTKGDILPWRRIAPDGRFVQVRFAGADNALQDLGFEVIASSLTRMPREQGGPVVLWRPGARGGGILVMDLEMLNARPGFLYEENLAALILANALGRPQTSIGRYLAPVFDYDAYCAEIHELAARRPLITLKEEGAGGDGRPIYSLSLGPGENRPFFVDCGIHPYEWAPGFGVLMYLARLADEFERGMPWAKALLGKVRFMCVPVYVPDGFETLAGDVRGVNLNRNFPTWWENHQGADKGAAPLCAAETAVVAEILRRERPVAAVNFHETNAATNWIGAPGFEGRYAKYALSVPAIFAQTVDPGLFFRHAALWTQNFDRRNLCWHYMDSYPYLRDYGESLAPYEIHYADSLGIDGILVEQYGNMDVSIAATPQRTELAARITEMLFGLQIGLVCRNYAGPEKHISIPLMTGGGGAEAVVWSHSGQEMSRRKFESRGDVALIEATLPEGAVLHAGRASRA